VARSLHNLFADIEIPQWWKPSDSPWSRAHEIVWWERELSSDIHPEIRKTIENVVKKLQPIETKEQQKNRGNAQKW
jgi:hypothetical protein